MSNFASVLVAKYVWLGSRSWFCILDVGFFFLCDQLRYYDWHLLSPIMLYFISHTSCYHLLQYCTKTIEGWIICCHLHNIFLARYKSFLQNCTKNSPRIAIYSWRLRTTWNKMIQNYSFTCVTFNLIPLYTIFGWT